MIYVREGFDRVATLRADCIGLSEFMRRKRPGNGKLSSEKKTGETPLNVRRANMKAVNSSKFSNIVQP